MARNTTGATGVTSGAFSAQVSAITSAFGDPTRRAVYLYVRDANDGVTAAQVATKFDVHPNVARHHLDKLAAGGYLEVEVSRTEKTGAGRPSKRYRAVDTAAPMQFPVRSDDLVLSLLGEAIERLPRHEAEAMAEEVGRKYGQAMAAGLTGDDVAAGQRSLRSALQKVADALTAHGFAAHAEVRQGRRHHRGLKEQSDALQFRPFFFAHHLVQLNQNQQLAVLVAHTLDDREVSFVAGERL
ncbi:MAG: hypothetical protein EBR63_00470 [Actinobacteria bacterium]|nr:hypothetical protein [Actinomycetota bacterium]